MSRALAPPMPEEVAAVMGGYGAPVRRPLGTVRELIFELVEAARIGPLRDTLKWG